jgi:hypothetical protein
VHKKLLTILASVALIVAGTAVASGRGGRLPDAEVAASSQNAASASADAHHKRIGHQRAAHPSSDITSFSSSSGLHIGVNHPPKNR